MEICLDPLQVISQCDQFLKKHFKAHRNWAKEMLTYIYIYIYIYIIHSWWQGEFDWRFPKTYFYGGGQFQVTIHWWFIQHQTCITLLCCQWPHDASKEAFCNMFRNASIFLIVFNSGQNAFVRVIYLSVTAKAPPMLICCPCWGSLKIHKHMYVGKFLSMLHTLSWIFAWLGRCEGSVMLHQSYVFVL
jgi:hypothetical protein